MRHDYLPRPCKSALLTAILTFGVLALTSARASAQEFISPFIGFNFGGDSGCPTATNCEDRHNNFGVSGGKLGAIGGGEVEFAYAKDFFGDAPGVDTSVLTLFGNVIIGPRFGFIRPFFLGGLGLIKSHVELTAGSLLDSSNNFGWDLGGGLMFMFGDHIGVRGNLRRYQSFQNQTILGFSLAEEKLKFNRVTAGLVIGF